VSSFLPQNEIAISAIRYIPMNIAILIKPLGCYQCPGGMADANALRDISPSRSSPKRPFCPGQAPLTLFPGRGFFVAS
jgi:hypothetical protein